MSDGILLIEQSRSPITVDQQRDMLRWSFGEYGEMIARAWSGFNQAFWEGELKPIPIWFPTAVPYGRWLGAFTGNWDNEPLSIQIKAGTDLETAISVLLHEMVHQYLCENWYIGKHNANPWCSEIMRLTKEIWGMDIWAAPDSPRKVSDGAGGKRSIRVQKPGPDGQKSLPRKVIAGYPDSLDVDLSKLLDYMGD